MSNLSPYAAPFKFTQITPAYHAIAAGAAGYVDTDCSGDIGAVARKCLVLIWNAGGQSAGARTTGTTDDYKKVQTAGITNVIFVNSNAAGHIDFYRNAAISNQYQIEGYAD